MTDLKQHSQVISICILLHHVNVLTCFDGLVESNRVFTLNHSVNSHLFVDTVKVFFADITDFNDFASIDFFSRIHSRSHSLLFCPIYILKKIGSKLSLAHFSMLAFSKHIIDEYNKSIHFTNSWLTSLTS